MQTLGVVLQQHHALATEDIEETGVLMSITVIAALVNTEEAVLIQDHQDTLARVLRIISVLRASILICVHWACVCMAELALIQPMQHMLVIAATLDTQGPTVLSRIVLEVLVRTEERV